MSNDELRKLRKNLTKEDKQELADRFAVTYGHIQNVLSRPRNMRHEKILMAAAKMVLDQKQKIKEVNDLLKVLE